MAMTFVVFIIYGLLAQAFRQAVISRRASIPGCAAASPPPSPGSRSTSRCQIDEDMPMQKIRITSRKYDGRLRDEYEALLYAEDDERLVVYAPVGTLSYDRHTQAWVEAPDGLLEIYFKNALV